MDGAGDVSVNMNEWSTGSGHGDYVVTIRNDAFQGLADDAYIYLYSAFSDAASGFEEWYLQGPSQLSNTVDVTAHYSSTNDTGEVVEIPPNSETLERWDRYVTRDWAKWAMKAIHSHTLTLQGLIAAWQIVGQENAILAQTKSGISFRPLRASCGRKAAREKL